ncbi:MAG TPA: phospho-sugar mutase [Vulgatibacter sp.]|nr:phospho-sugar mutase [Vulgatibacter sp.]
MDPVQLREAAERWLAEDPDPGTRRELQGILDRGDAAALAERFGGALRFGTAGLRGKVGAGPNRMNRLVVIRTTAGLARHLLDHVPAARTRGVVVGCDGRHLSAEAREDVVEVLAGHGIRARVFRDLAPTPLVAFAVSHLAAAGGVMITASHNPAAYNGYKVYWENGAQIVPPHDAGIARAIDAVGPLAGIPRMARGDATAAGLLEELGEETILAYLDRISTLSRQKPSRRLRIAYTPMHGVGGDLALRALSRFGFDDVHVVSEQMAPHPDFPTVAFPNPEEAGAMDLVLSLASRIAADLVLANDPDADRLAVSVPREAGTYQALSGNEIGVLLASWLLDPPPEGKPLAITTIVSTPMLATMCEQLGVRCEEVLTGFKWIANRAMDLEAREGARFVLGFEEALGYSLGTICRDKDGISAAAVFAELAASGDVLGRLEDLFRRYGLHVSGQSGFTAEGASGQAAIRATMERLRRDPPRSIGGRPVVALRDYLTGRRTAADGATSRLDLPPSDVLAFDLEGGSRVVARPSGTEPKIKYYFDVCEPVSPSESIAEARARARRILDDVARDFSALASPPSG